VPETNPPTDMNHLILSALMEFEQGVKSSVLAGHLRLTHRDVVGRLQALKRQGSVSYVRSSPYPSAAGLWYVSEEG